MVTLYFPAWSPLCAIVDTVVDYNFIEKLLMKAFPLAQKFQGQMETVAWPKVVRPRIHATVILLHSQHCLSVLLCTSKFQNRLLCVYLPKQRITKASLHQFHPFAFLVGLIESKVSAHYCLCEGRSEECVDLRFHSLTWEEHRESKLLTLSCYRSSTTPSLELSSPEQCAQCDLVSIKKKASHMALHCSGTITPYIPSYS